MLLVVLYFSNVCKITLSSLESIKKTFNASKLPNITGTNYPASVIDSVSTGGSVEWGGVYFPANSTAADYTLKLRDGAFKKRKIVSNKVWDELRAKLGFDVGNIYFSSSSPTLSTQYGIVDEFDASLSNSIYTNNFNKVQPDSTQIYLYMKLN